MTIKTAKECMADVVYVSYNSENKIIKTEIKREKINSEEVRYQYSDKAAKVVPYIFE